MKLYYYPGACNLADHIALIEAALPYTLDVITPARTTQDGRDFRAINPKGHIPVLELDDGTHLTENQVILNYIAESSGKLLPKAGMARWRVFEALAFMSSVIHPAYSPFFKNYPEIEKARAREKLAANFAILASQIGSHPYLVGESMTIADCYLFWVVMVAPRSGVELPATLQDFYARMKLRPSVVQALAEEGIR